MSLNLRDMRWVTLAGAVLASTALVAAQSKSPVADALRAGEARYEKNIVGAAETMPADRFATRPTEKQMSFADLTRHLIGGNYMLCGWISGQQPPDMKQVPAASADKDTLVKALKASFDYCRTGLARLDDSALDQQVPFFGGRKVTRATAILELSADWGDHYSLQATELRLAGQLPPTAQRQGDAK